MTTAHLTTSLTSQPRQGVGARFVRRLGGAVRSLVSGGITLVGGLRRPGAPSATRVSSDVPRGRRSSPRREPAAAAASLSLCAAWLTGAHRRRGLANRPDAAYLPEVYAGLSPEARTFLTTPMEECDPAKLELLFSTFQQHIAEALSSGTGLKDSKALFAKVCGCFDAAIDHAEPAAAPAASSAVTDAASAATIDIAVATTLEASPEEPAEAVADAPPASPLVLFYARAATSPASAIIPDAAAPAAMPDSAASPKPVRGRGGDRSFARSRRMISHRHRSQFHRCRQPFGGGIRVWHGLRIAPSNLPTRRLCYAACAGPS